MPLSRNASIRAARATRVVERMTRNHPGHRARWAKHGGLRIVGFTLTEDMGKTTAGEASATVSLTWSPSTESYTGSDVGTVVDPMGIFADALDGEYGKGIMRQGDDRTVIDPLVISC